MNLPENIGIVGEGKMGTSVIQYLMDYDFTLYWLCSSNYACIKAQKSVNRKIKTLQRCDILSADEAEAKLSTIIVSCDHNDLIDCDLIIEAITENLDEKRTVFGELDKTVKAGCILCSNSSSIIPSLISSSVKRKEKLAGLHFFFPVNLKSTVELIASEDTSLATVEYLRTFILQIQKVPFIQNEADAFILNRILLDFQAGAFQILKEERLTISQIDTIVKQYMFPVGVFEFFDHVGIDVMLASIKSYIQHQKDTSFYQPMLQHLEKLNASGHTGIKAGRGLYIYPLDSVSQVSNEIPVKDKKEIARCLWNYYITTVKQITDKGICRTDDLRNYMKDYLGMDEDPFVLHF